MKKVINSSRIGLLLTPRVGDLDKNNIAGTERIFLNDLEFLRSKGYNVLAFSRFDFVKLGIKKIFFPRSILVVANYLKQSNNTLSQYLSNLCYLLADLIYTFIFIIKTLKCDVVIGYTTPNLAIFRPKSSILIMGFLELFLLSRIFKSKYNKCRILYVSSSMKKQYEAQYSLLKGGNGTVLYNAVDLSFFKPKNIIIKENGKIKLLFTSAWVYQKGLTVILDALIRLPENIRNRFQLTISSNARLWFQEFPNNNYILQVRRKIPKLGNIVKELGGVRYEKMPNVYNGHDYLVFPSIWEEPFGLVLLEALACGLPVITFVVGGVSEIVSKSNSLFPHKKTAESLGALLVRIYNNKVFVKKRNNSLLTSKNRMMISGHRFSKLLVEIGKLVR